MKPPREHSHRCPRCRKRWLHSGVGCRIYRGKAEPSVCPKCFSKYLEAA
jgi:predicted Zn-ribbon and HTH transcriptional regulator